MIFSVHTFLSIVMSNHISTVIFTKRETAMLSTIGHWGNSPANECHHGCGIVGYRGRRSPTTTDGLITLPQCSIATKTHLYLYIYSFADFNLYLCDLEGFMIAPQKTRLRRAIELIVISCPPCKSCSKAPLEDVGQTRTIGECMLSYGQRFVCECKPNCICWSNELECVKKVQVIIALTN